MTELRITRVHCEEEDDVETHSKNFLRRPCFRLSAAALVNPVLFFRTHFAAYGLALIAVEKKEIECIVLV
jgi:hypothetical protein